MSSPEVNTLITHLFRHESGKMISVLTGIFGSNNLILAEDIVQDTLEEAIDNWTYKGIPENPTAWLYKVAKNKAINALKRKSYQNKYIENIKHNSLLNEQDYSVTFSDKNIADDQLRMMFLCCHPSISENSQVALILKILCGFSISEIADSFFTNRETINKRLVRARKTLKKNDINFELPANINENLSIVLKTIYLLFNESYFPNRKNKVLRYDLCIEAIRLLEFLNDNSFIEGTDELNSLLALTYLNASRFKARIGENGSIIDLENQDRKLWSKSMIQKGVQYLTNATKSKNVSSYLILATISAQHCIAHSFEATNWNEIVLLYDQLLLLEDSPIIRLNRSVAVAKAKSNQAAISELEMLNLNSDIGDHFLFHSTLGELYKKEKQTELAKVEFKKAIAMSQNERDHAHLRKKLADLVPVSKNQLL